MNLKYVLLSGVITTSNTFSGMVPQYSKCLVLVTSTISPFVDAWISSDDWYNIYTNNIVCFTHKSAFKYDKNIEPTDMYHQQSYIQGKQRRIPSSQDLLKTFLFAHYKRYSISLLITFTVYNAVFCKITPLKSYLKILYSKETLLTNFFWTFHKKLNAD